jgi:hypothetical protein
MMKLRRRLERVEGVLQPHWQEEDRRQDEQLAAWLRTLSDEELDAVATAVQALCEQEAVHEHP